MAKLWTTMAVCVPLGAALLALSLAVPPSLGAQHTALKVVAHPSCGVSSLSADQLGALFTSSQRRWDTGVRVVPINYPARHPVRVAFDRAVLGMEPAQVAQFWITRRVRGQGTAPRSAPNSRLIAKLVGRFSGAVGYVPTGVATPGAVTVARVENGRVIPGSGK